jgi:hypothetical protein
VLWGSLTRVMTATGYLSPRLPHHPVLSIDDSITNIHDASNLPSTLLQSPNMASSASSRPLTRASVEAAHALIKPHIHDTPVLTNTTLTNLASTPQTADALKGTQWEGQEPAKPKVKLFFKCENLQRIGAFKVRGAFHAVTRLVEEQGLEEVRRKGVVTHSSGKFDSSTPLPPIVFVSRRRWSLC